MVVTNINPECCGNCEFYMETTKVCRRYPPMPLMLGLRQGLAGNEPAVSSFFPSMMPTGWCGEYRPEASVGENNYAGNS